MKLLIPIFCCGFDWMNLTNNPYNNNYYYIVKYNVLYGHFICYHYISWHGCEVIGRGGFGSIFDPRLGQPSMVWVWKIFPKNPKFSIFFPSGQKKSLWVWSKSTWVTNHYSWYSPLLLESLQITITLTGSVAVDFFPIQG